MSDNQPRQYDAVLGGDSQAPVDGVVLGGIEGAKQRFASNSENYRILALEELIRYGEEGLDLVIHGLKDSSENVKIKAYKLLRKLSNSKAKRAIKNINHYRFFKCLCSLEQYSTRTCSIYFNSDNHTIFFGGYRGIFLYNWQTRMLQRRDLEGHSDEVNFFKFNLNYDRIIGGSYRDERIKVWDWDTGQNIAAPIKQYSDGINSIALVPDNKTLIIGCINGLIKIYNWQTGELQKIIEDEFRGSYINLSIDGNTLVKNNSQIIKVLDWKKNKIKNFIEEERGITCAIITPDGQSIVHGCKDEKIKVRDIKTGYPKLIFNSEKQFKRFKKGIFKPIDSMAINSSGDIIVTGDWEGKVKIWNLHTGELKCTLEKHLNQVECVAISPDEQIIVSHSPSVIKIWGLE